MSCTHDVEVTGGCVVGQVSTELWDSEAEVPPVLSMELNVAVTLEEDELKGKGSRC